MRRYIDLSTVLGNLHERLDFLLSECGEYDAYYSGFEEAVERLEDLAVVDAVEVVRCKCCMFRSTIDDDYTRLQCPTGFMCQLTNKLVRESDFCSYGKREGGCIDGVE